MRHNNRGHGSMGSGGDISRFVGNNTNANQRLSMSRNPHQSPIREEANSLLL